MIRGALLGTARAVVAFAFDEADHAPAALEMHRVHHGTHNENAESAGAVIGFRRWDAVGIEAGAVVANFYDEGVLVESTPDAHETARTATVFDRIAQGFADARFNVGNVLRAKAAQAREVDNAMPGKTDGSRVMRVPGHVLRHSLGGYPK